MHALTKALSTIVNQAESCWWHVTVASERIYTMSILKRQRSFFSFALLLAVLSCSSGNVLFGQQHTVEPDESINREMSLTERLWRANHDPERLPEDLRDSYWSGADRSTVLAPFGKSAVASPDPADVNWVNILPQETDDDIFAIATHGRNVYVGGGFTQIAGIEAEGVAHWDGSQWTALENEAGQSIEGFVFALAVTDDKLYVGGQFTQAGGITANGIAVWDRTNRSWSGLGNGVQGDGSDVPFISAIKVVGERVYVAGSFTKAGGTDAENIAVWDGSSWSSLGGGVHGTVSALEYFQGNLYAGGSFSTAGNIASNAIALWNGTDWEGMDGGLNGFVNEIKVSGDSGIVVGGLFNKTLQDTVFVRNIVWWTGEWTNRGKNDPFGMIGEQIHIEGEVRALLVDGENLWVGGQFTHGLPRAGGSPEGPLNNVAVFSNPVEGAATWDRLRDGANSSVNALGLVEDVLFVGGNFSRVDGLASRHIAKWEIDQRRWLEVAAPVAHTPVHAMTLFNNTLYAAGAFTATEPGDFTATSRAALLDQRGWQLVDGVVRGNIYSMISTADNLLIGGSFITSDELVTVNLARYNPASGEWNALTPGSGVASLDDVSFVTAMVMDGDNLYIGGSFTIADTISVNNVVCWNSQTGIWKALGDGLNGPVRSLAIDDEGNLYAGGEFTASGTVLTRGVARWDGSEWSALGEGVEGPVRALAYSEGVLYAGGTFRKAGGEEAINVAQWNVASGEWSRMGLGLDSEFKPSVEDFAFSAGRVFAAGRFDVTGQDTVLNVARWNPGGWWDRLGSGTDQPALAIVVDESDGDVYFGGTFLIAGCKDAKYTALWRDPTLSVEAENTPMVPAYLAGSLPNPFSSVTRLHLTVPDGKVRDVSIVLHDVAGREVRELFSGAMDPGEYDIDVEGKDLPAGMYFVRFRSGDVVETLPLIRQ